MSYQQVFRVFPKSRTPVETLHTGLHNPGIHRFFPMLRHRRKTEIRLHFFSKKFTFCNSILSKPVEACFSFKIFCEKSPISTGVYHPANPGNTFPITDFRR